jgi:hypothetical protein
VRDDLGEMSPAEIMASYRPGSEDPPWTWDDERQSLFEEECKCCGSVGTYQKRVIQRLQGGWFGDPIKLGDDGRLWDGHHRLLAAHALRMEKVPVHYGKTEYVPERGLSMVFQMVTDRWRNFLIKKET